MATETTTHRIPGRLGLLALLLVVGVGATLAGVRWHEAIERRLAPWIPAVAAPDQPAVAGQLWTCGMHPQVIQDHPGNCPICHMKLVPLKGVAGRTEPGAPSGRPAESAAITIDPVVVQNMGVRLAPVTMGPIRRTVRAFGSLEEREPDHLDINLRVSGWIQTLYAATDGMPLRQGDPMFDLYSPELTLAIDEAIAARHASFDLPPDTDAASRDSAGSMYAAALERLQRLGLTPEQATELTALERAPRTVTFLSPKTGHVTSKAGLYAGAAVTAGQRVMRLAERSNMWMEAQIPERQVALIHEGQKAVVTIDAWPGRRFEGEVIFIHPHLDMATRTAMARVSLPNPTHELREGMYGTVRIEVEEAESAVLVPREAVIDTGETRIAFVALAGGRFEPRRVTMGLPAEDGMVQILEGLAPGESVVTSAQFLIDSESRMREAIQKFVDEKRRETPGAIPVPAGEPPSIQTPPGASDGTGSARAPGTEPGPGPALDALVIQYLRVADVLGAGQTTDSPLDLAELVGAARVLRDQSLGADHEAMVAALVLSAEAMGDRPLDRQRDAFKELSTRLIAVMESLPPSRSVGDPLFVLHCPMAPGDWVQRTSVPANPFYATEMKGCGEVARIIVPRGSAGP